jgi:phosphoribosylaminoimidazole (AIR) synthetase
MGIGMVLVVDRDGSDQILERSEGARRIGVVNERAGVRLI